ncbi:acyltransferase family protein [Enterococcus casseliflavus]|uniref:acyltransferase family protein n=1 Tax=Enterococcus casseliflavus TaxID=37734 RepID=UPI0039A4D293
MQTKGRLKYLDTSKGLGILLIIYGHITAIDNPIDTWMSSFKITIFFIITGYLLAHKGVAKKISLKEYINKLFKALLIPYFLFSILATIFYGLVSIPNGKFLFTILINIYMTLSFRGISTLWFLPALFIGQVIFFWVQSSPKIVKILSFIFSLLISFMTVILLNNLENVLGDSLYHLISMPILTLGKGLIAFWFIFVGYYSYKLLAPLKSTLLIGFVFFILNIFISKFNTGIDLNFLNFGSTPILFFLCGILGSIGTILIFKSLTERMFFPILNFCGNNSLILMCTHLPFGIAVIMYLYNKFFTMPTVPSFSFYVHTLMILAVLMILEYFIIIFVNKKASFLIGKKLKKAI